MFRKMYLLTGCCLTSVLNVQSVHAAVNSAADASYQLAYVQFLPDYQDSAWGGKHSMVIPGRGGLIPNVEDQCKEHGYTITSCPAGTTPSERCPYGSKSYYKECIDNDDACINKGYFKTCPDGKVPDVSEYCEYDHSYVKCECDDCSGYDYSYEQATASGYIVDGEGCQSCDEIKYKRKANPCTGYGYDSSNCGNVSCGILSGETCQSGNTVKYAECRACTTEEPEPPVEEKVCPSGKIDIDTYWCDGWLRCYWPAPDNEAGCSQTTCLDYPYTEISCMPGYVKVSCKDSCVGTRYKCEKASGCDGYDKTSQTGCQYGYLDCVDTSGQTLYKCKDCSTTGCESFTLTSDSSCSYGAESCTTECGKTTYRCKTNTRQQCIDAGYGYTSTDKKFDDSGWEVCPYDSGYYKYMCPTTISTLNQLNMVLSGKCSNRDDFPTYKIKNNISGSFQTCSSNCNFSLDINLMGNTLQGDLDFEKMTGGVTLSGGTVAGSISGPGTATLTLKSIVTNKNLTARAVLNMDGCTVSGYVKAQGLATISGSTIKTTGCTALYVHKTVNMTNTNLSSSYGSYCGYGNGLINPEPKSTINMNGGTLSCSSSGNHVFNTTYIGYAQGVTVNISASNLTLNTYEDNTLTVGCP